MVCHKKIDFKATKCSMKGSYILLNKKNLNSKINSNPLRSDIKDKTSECTSSKDIVLLEFLNKIDPNFTFHRIKSSDFLHNLSEKDFNIVLKDSWILKLTFILNKKENNIYDSNRIYTNFFNSILFFTGEPDVEVLKLLPEFIRWLEIQENQIYFENYFNNFASEWNITNLLVDLFQSSNIPPNFKFVLLFSSCPFALKYIVPLILEKFPFKLEKSTGASIGFSKVSLQKLFSIRSKLIKQNDTLDKLEEIGFMHVFRFIYHSNFISDASFTDIFYPLQKEFNLQFTYKDLSCNLYKNMENVQFLINTQNFISTNSNKTHMVKNLFFKKTQIFSAFKFY